MKVVKLADVVEFNPEKLKKVSLFDTDNFFCDHILFRTGLNRRKFIHMVILIKFTMCSRVVGMVTVGSEEKELGPDEITIAPAGEDHGVVNHTQDKLVMLVLMAPKP